jgi:hypothetical protein
MKMSLRVYSIEQSTFLTEEYFDVPFIPRVGEYIVTNQGQMEVLKVIYNFQQNDKIVSVYV